MTDYLYRASYNNPLYNTWKDMRKRCTNKSRKDYKWYGAMGISVCPRWENFREFAADMAPTWFIGATIERKDRLGNYEPSNCRWVTIGQQQLNRGNVRKLWELSPKVRALREEGNSQDTIANILGISQGTVSRILMGGYKHLEEGDCA